MTQQEDESTAVEVSQQLYDLRQDRVDAGFVEMLYGLDVRKNDDLKGLVNKWGEEHSEREIIQEDGVDRVALETFLQRRNRLPCRWAAVQLGMTEKSFRKVLEVLTDQQMVDWGITNQLVPEAEIRTFHQLFDSLRLRVFRDINDKISRIHQELNTEYDLDICPVYCVTSERLDPDEPAFAQSYDALIPQRGMSLRYQVWLRTGKPMHLRPDGTSSLTLCEHREVLEGNLFPGEDGETPPALC